MRKKTRWNHLTFRDRIKIEALYKQKISKAAIAAEIGCSLSTIYRELPKGYYNYYGKDLAPEVGYSADIAQKRYDNNASAKGASLRLGHDFRFATFVEDKIREGYSPAAVLEFAQESPEQFETHICVKTLYSYIHQGFFLGVSSEDLPRKGIHKRNYEKVRRCSIKRPLNASIDDRPEEINERTTFGHWEMDTVLGKAKGGGPVLLVLTERLTRREIIMKISSRTQEAVTKALNKLERKFGKSFRRVFRTITIDNGSEFLDPEKIERSCRMKSKRTKVYYCHPFSSWERGSNENANGMIRRKIPKGTSIAPYTNREISEVEHWINHYSRKIHGYRCAEKLFQEQLKQLNL